MSSILEYFSELEMGQIHQDVSIRLHNFRLNFLFDVKSPVEFNDRMTFLKIAQKLHFIVICHEKTTRKKLEIKTKLKR